MTKRDIKARIHKAIKRAPYQESIKRVALFGSYAYGKPKRGSDVDILIEFKPNSLIGLFEMVDLEDHFKKALRRKVDLRTPAELSKYFRDDVLKKASPIYKV